MEQSTIPALFYQEFILGLLPIEWVLEEDFELSGSSPAGRELAGAQGGIPPGAGHPEAAVLPSGRVGNEFGCPRLSWDSVLGEGFGERCLAEAGQALRNPGFSRRGCPALGGMPPWAWAIVEFSSFLPTRSGEDHFFFLNFGGVRSYSALC